MGLRRAGSGLWNELAGWVNGIESKWSSTVRKPARTSASRRRRRSASRLERLESRTVFNSDSAPLGISPLWFNEVDNSQVSIEAMGLRDPSSELKWIVQFDPNLLPSTSTVADTARLLSGLPAQFEVERGLGKIGQVLVSTWNGNAADVGQWLAANSQIVSYVTDLRIQATDFPNDPSLPSVWSLDNTAQGGVGVFDADVDAPEAWSIATGNRSTIVAILDTGIDYTHPDLAANVWTNPGEVAGDGIDNDANGFVDDVHGWDFVNNDKDPLDDNGHGTHVAGTIGAVGNNGVGVAGINWNVSLMALKFLDSTGSGSESGAIAALNYAAMMRERGQNIVATSNSYSGASSNPNLKAAITANRDAGILFIAAAGNSTTNIDTTPTYPASFAIDNVIAVAATDQYDRLASFSNWGSNTVAVAAPGVSILSTTKGGGYGTKSGTSMATPLVAGLVALAYDVAPDADYQQIRDAILASVDPLSSLTGKVTTGGRINAANTLNYLLTNTPATPRAYLAHATTYQALDLVAGGAGVVTALDGTNDGAAALNLGANSFTLYGQTYTGANALYVSSNGLLSFGSSYTAATNTNLTAVPTPPVIAPLWDDLRTDFDTADQVLAKFEDLTGDGVPDRLIVEWSNVRHAGTTSAAATFQAILKLNTGAADGDIVFNYPDLDFGNASWNEGGAATVGIKGNGAQGVARLLISKDFGQSPLVGTGQAVLLDRTRPTAAITAYPANNSQGGTSSIDVTFSELIDGSTFDYRDISLTLYGGPNLINNGVTTSYVSGNTWRISGLSPLTTASGNYQIQVNTAGITDVVGHSGLTVASASWIAGTLPPAVDLISATADGFGKLLLSYRINSSNVQPFSVTAVRSDDELVGDDVTLGAIAISNAIDLTLGSHTLSVPIGSGTGKIALPGAGTAEVDSDYSLLIYSAAATVGMTGQVGSPVVLFTGTYHLPASPVYYHGTAAADTITIGSTASFAVNGVTTTYTAADVTGFRVRPHGGNDSVDGTSYTKALGLIGGGGNDVLKGGSAADLLNGGAGDDTLIANAGNDILIGEAGKDLLTGGAGNDTYQFNTDSQLDIDTLDESGGGVDTLDLSASSSLTVTLDLSLATAQVVNANLSLILGSTTNFENVIGGNQSDKLTGNAGNNNLVGGPGDDTLVGGNGSDSLEGGEGDDTLIGGASSDSYFFAADVPLGTDTIDESAGGTELLDFSRTQQSVRVDLSVATLQTVNANLALILNSATTIENVTGGAGDDTLLGNALNNILIGNAGDDWLDGGAGNDTFLYNTNTNQGSDTIAEEPLGGRDTLDFSTTTTQSITVDVSNTNTQVVNANLSLTILNSTSLDRIVGGALDDTLIGNALDNILTGNAGNDTLIGNAGNDTLNGLAGNDELIGGDGNDIYQFWANAPQGIDNLTETDNGGDDLLDFSGTTVSGVTVNLGITTAQAVAPLLTLTLSSPVAFEMVFGTKLADTLIGNSAANVLVGAAGNDTLIGLAGRDLLVGGSGTDSLNGGDDDDILIGGTLTYATDTVLDLVALDALLAEWSRTDLDYAKRMNNLRNGTGLNGKYKLTSSTVPADNVADALSGANGLDWFWTSVGDSVTDQGTGGIESLN